MTISSPLRSKGSGRGPGGFTLVELMMVVGIIGILASVALPKYAEVIHRAQEGATRGNLGALRSALSIYYVDNGGNYPTCVAGADSTAFSAGLVPKYIAAVPTIKNGLHPAVSSVYCDYELLPGIVHDSQGWYYDGAIPLDSQAGTLWVACDHTDGRGSFWTAY